MSVELPMDRADWFYTVVTATGTGLSRPIGAVVAAVIESDREPSPGDLERVKAVLDAGKSILIVTASEESRAKILGSLGRVRPTAGGGRA